MLLCAGTARGTPCHGAAFAKATGPGPISPHFASRHHAQDCDHAATRPTDTCRHPDHAQPSAEPTVLQLTGSATHPSSTRTTGRGLTARREDGAAHASLHSALQALRSDGIPPGLLVQWRSARPRPAWEFFIHLDSATREQTEPSGYWGIIQRVYRHQGTGSLHVLPRAGARIVIAREAVADLPLLDESLAGRWVLAVGALRRARSGHQYVLVTQATAIAVSPVADSN